MVTTRSETRDLHEWLAAVPGPVLTAAAGWLDALAFISDGGLFASVMTGNIVLLGMHLAPHPAPGDPHHLLIALGAYCLGVAACSVFLRHESAKSQWTRRIVVAFVVEIALLVGYSAVWLFAEGPRTHFYLAIALASGAMGVQGEAVRNLPGKMTTTYMTGALTSAVSAIARLQWRPARATILRLTALLAGAGAGAWAWYGSTHLAMLTPAFLVAIALLVGYVSSVAERRGSRRRVRTPGR